MQEHQTIQMAALGQRHQDDHTPFVYLTDKYGPGPRKVDTSGVSYAAWVSVADVSASKVSGA